MKLTRLRSPEMRAIYFKRLEKWLGKRFSPASPNSVPLFILGMQRSGTSMLMSTLHLRSDTEVFDESRDNSAFVDFRLRNLEHIDRLIEESWAPYVCFKPIADSHRVDELMERFRNGFFIWIYRDYRDVANSRLRKFPNANRAIKLVCSGQEGGGWFDEGVSQASRTVLRQLDASKLSEFDFACLTWWARNRIFVDNELWLRPQVRLVNYEKLVQDPVAFFHKLMGTLAMGVPDESLRFIHPASVGRHAFPGLDPAVENLCNDLLAELNQHQT